MIYGITSHHCEHCDPIKYDSGGFYLDGGWPVRADSLRGYVCRDCDSALDAFEKED